MTTSAVVIMGSERGRAFVSAEVERAEGWVLSGAAGHGIVGVDLVQGFRPDVVVLDVGLAQLASLRVLKQIMVMRPSAVVGVSSRAEVDGFVLMEFLRLGAVDCVAKPSFLAWEEGEFGNSLHAAMRRAACCRPELRRLPGLDAVSAPLVEQAWTAEMRLVVVAVGPPGLAPLLDLLATAPAARNLVIVVLADLGPFSAQAMARYLSRFSLAGVSAPAGPFQLHGGVQVVDSRVRRRCVQRYDGTIEVESLGPDSPGGSAGLSGEVFRELLDGLGDEVATVLLPGCGADVASLSGMARSKRFFVIDPEPFGDEALVSLLRGGRARRLVDWQQLVPALSHPWEERP